MEQRIERHRESEVRGPPVASAAERSLAVARPLGPGITTAPISPPPGLSQVDHMADGVTASTSPSAATPSLKNEPGELAAEAAQGLSLPLEWAADKIAITSGSISEPMASDALYVDMFNAADEGGQNGV